MENKVTIKIPRELYQKLRAMVAGTGFSSVNEFIVFVTRTLASTGAIEGADTLSAEDARVRKQGTMRVDNL